MASLLTRSVLRDELGAQQELFQRAMAELGAQVQRDIREELRRCLGSGAGVWGEETLLAPRSSWNMEPWPSRKPGGPSGAPTSRSKDSSNGPKAAVQQSDVVSAVLLEAAVTEVEDAQPATEVQEPLPRCTAARPGCCSSEQLVSSTPATRVTQVEAAPAAPAAAAAVAATSLRPRSKEVDAAPAAISAVAFAAAPSPRPCSKEGPQQVASSQLLPGQAEEQQQQPKPRTLGVNIEAARRASMMSMRNSNMSQMSAMSSVAEENFPNDLRLPTMLTRSAKARDGRRFSMNSRRQSLSSVTSTETKRSHRSKTLSGGTESTSVVPAPGNTRRLSFLSTRLGMEDVLSEHDTFKRIVYHPYFDLTVVILILLNGLSIGVQTDVMARAVSEELPVGLRVVEICFCVAFTVELALRFVVERKEFFRGPEMGWNIFDSVVILLQLIEEALGIAAAATGTESYATSSNFGFVRMLRALRLIRIIRLVRVLRLIGELRTIVMSIASSMKHLFWTLVLLLMMIYIFSVPLTQIVLDHRLGHEDAELTELLLCWDSIGRSSLTLFEAIFGGIDWDIAVMPLVNYVHLMLAPVFCLYIAFSLLALMNVVTGVFVESAIDSANRDKEKYLVQIARDLFEKADPNNTGVITWAEFERQLANPELQQYFKGLGVDAVSARSLFRILDLDNSGAIDADELLTGTLRLRGDAKAIDLAALIYESRRMSRRFQAHALAVDDALARLNSQLCLLAPGGALDDQPPRKAGASLQTTTTLSP